MSIVMAEYGAWTTDYYLTTPRMGGKGDRIQYAIESIQVELAYNGFTPEAALVGTFDPATRAATVDFQRKSGLKTDGIVGPYTARALCQKRIFDASNHHSVNPLLTAGIIRVESAYDFGAVGFVDHRDRGLGQINSAAHPTITDIEAYTSSFSIRWVAKYMQAALQAFMDDECAIASYNLGYGGARSWCANKSSNVGATAYVQNVLEGA